MSKFLEDLDGLNIGDGLIKMGRTVLIVIAVVILGVGVGLGIWIF